MSALRTLPLLALLVGAAACGGSEPAAPIIPAASGSFDWDKWAAVVNEYPCGWLSADDLAALRITGPGTPETTATETRCLWTDAEGALVFSAGVTTWDSAANLAGERAEQVRLAGEMGSFSHIEGSAGTVTAIYRRDRARLSIFPNADSETAMILINAQKTMRDDDAAKAAKDERAKAYATKLIAAYGL